MSNVTTILNCCCCCCDLVFLQNIITRCYFILFRSTRIKNQNVRKYAQRLFFVFHTAII